MRTIIVVLLLALLSCTKTVYVPKPVERKIETTVTYVDTVVLTEIERETVQTFVPIDTTANAETKYARASAKVRDGTLSLSIENKSDAKIPTNSIYIIKEVRDSIPYPVDVPIPVEVVTHPWWMKILSLIGVIALAFLSVKRFIKLWVI